MDSLVFSTIHKQLTVGKLDGFAKRLPRVVTSIPFFDPERKRPRNIYSE